MFDLDSDLFMMDDVSDVSVLKMVMISMKVFWNVSMYIFIIVLPILILLYSVT
jgi:hypothetical protein